MTSETYRHYSVEEIISEKLIKTVYQPIVRLDSGSIIGFEALSRGPEYSNLASPMVMIEEAEKKNLIWELEILMRSLAIQRAKNLKRGSLLFLNVDPNILHDPKFQSGMTKDLIDQYEVDPVSIVFEITERSAIKDFESFRKILKNYTNQGYKIAIDDAGAGYSGMNTIVETSPNYIKIDMAIVRNVNSDTIKQAIVKSFVQIGLNTNIKVIAEGIETKEELKTLIQLGVYGGQGYYLQRPATEILALSQEKKDEILKYNMINKNNNNYSSHYQYIGMVADFVETFPPSELCSVIEHYFGREEFDLVCITVENEVAGVITRQNLYKAMATQYGHVIYTKRPISLLSDKDYLAVDYYTPISIVAERAMQRPSGKIYDAIIVEKGSKYYGTVSVKNLLEHSLRLEKDYARELNPLTDLPGNKIINRVLNDILKYSTVGTVVYFDLDNFKSYNDSYGFENGDQMIIMLSRILQENIKQTDAINSFIGHVGGDDFVAVFDKTQKDVIEETLKNIITAFDQDRLGFYSEADQDAGFVISEDRYGNIRNFELTSISIACLTGDFKLFTEVEQLTMEMAKLKKIVKRVPNSSYEIFEIN